MENNDGKRSRKRAGTTSALKDAPKVKRQKHHCKACGKNTHYLSRCYYAFPEIRPRGFKPIDKCVVKVAEALENAELAEEVQAIRNEW